MKDTTKAMDMMYARLKNKHNISFSLDETEYRMSDYDYSFLSTLWRICDTMDEWDKLVEKYKKKEM